MWLVLFESVKDRFLGVDPPKQLVSPRVQYGITYLLIRDAIGSVSYSAAWGRAQCLAWDPHGARGVCFGETVALQAGLLVRKP
jgi:hypothetical protein